MQAVDAFDPRFTLRALRNLSTIRKADNFAEAIVVGIRAAFPKPQNTARKVLEEMLPEKVTKMQNAAAAAAAAAKDPEETQVAEVWAYLGVLVQVSCWSES